MVHCVTNSSLLSSSSFSFPVNLNDWPHSAALFLRASQSTAVNHSLHSSWMNAGGSIRSSSSRFVNDGELHVFFFHSGARYKWKSSYKVIFEGLFVFGQFQQAEQEHVTTAVVMMMMSYMEMQMLKSLWGHERIIADITVIKEALKLGLMYLE